ncbi:hypothetical protein F2P56_024466 [Juglans regia]|uniref:Uncharacterized protein LOC108993603 n=2 Tax=Juglans regia TaxID=51240 RepID=A0A2I4EXL1_JUGRE|nr:uncharacterized protein LOC108993603 [Juglans regia]KAF5454830.1 hypothetical protein F2P56_024466 [Juglans regia]
MIHALFTKEDAKLINEIPLSPYPKPDRLIWRCTTLGEFSARSAYHLLAELDIQQLGKSSNQSNPHDPWTKLWNLRIPNTAKTFLWKACLNALPTRANLLKRKTLEEPVCPICIQQPETIEHILWDCPSTRDVWSHSTRKLQNSSPHFHQFKDLVASFMETLEHEELMSFSLISWLIWKRSNDMVFKDLFLHPMAITQQSAHLVEELQQNPQQTTSASTRQQPYMWEATPQGRVKLNWDEALDKRACKMGVGVVIRGSEGQILATLRMQHHLYPDHFLAEALATLQASLFYKYVGYSNVIMEGDSLQVVNDLNSTSDSITYAGQFIVDTRYNLNNFCDWSPSIVTSYAVGDSKIVGPTRGDIRTRRVIGLGEATSCGGERALFALVPVSSFVPIESICLCVEGNKKLSLTSHILAAAAQARRRRALVA